MGSNGIAEIDWLYPLEIKSILLGLGDHTIPQLRLAPTPGPSGLCGSVPILWSVSVESPSPRKNAEATGNCCKEATFFLSCLRTPCTKPVQVHH